MSPAVIITIILVAPFWKSTSPCVRQCSGNFRQRGVYTLTRWLPKWWACTVVACTQLALIRYYLKALIVYLFDEQIKPVLSFGAGSAWFLHEVSLSSPMKTVSTFCQYLCSGGSTCFNISIAKTFHLEEESVWHSRVLTVLQKHTPGSQHPPHSPETNPKSRTCYVLFVFPSCIKIC